ncbi:DNA repair protein RecO [Sandarakinorhabdus oryzae]|uniref:DNA repair protein RecO n=1 Tax=Sandarakinorhabdus oryzae TaxID=2675220 RepID=UPI0018CC7A8F|nr:DNA repair protein RecO [Sandarakinorhabdus oryzae]
MQRVEPALVVALAPHGEHAVVGRFLSAEQGLVAAYVQGGRGRKLRAVLQPGNRVALDLVTKSAGQLAFATVHPLTTNLALMHGPAALALVDYLASLAAATLPEGEPQPQLYPLFDALFGAAAAGALAADVGPALVRLELALLAELGIGLDLASCAATGTTGDLAFVSPKSRQAVSRSAGEPWASRLLPLPAFLLGQGEADAAAIADGLALTGHFLAREVLRDAVAAKRTWTARERLVGLLGR